MARPEKTYLLFSLIVMATFVTLPPLACTKQRESPPEGRSSEATPQATPQSSSEISEIPSATVSLRPTQRNNVTGSAIFTPAEQGGLHVKGRIIGLSPGEHGFHIHEKGDCSAPDASSAGEHFNPTDMPHGGPDAPRHHLGDLGNITANQDGVAQVDHVYPFLSLKEPNSIVGHSLIVHANKDDLTSQPAGNSGARVACGVIQANASNKQ